MHDSALIVGGKIMSNVFGKPGGKVLDLGGKNFNGSLRPFYEAKGMQYICVDLDADPSVDVVVEPGIPLPFPNEHFDLIVSTSCFEHDPCFWMTFKDMCRLVKRDGYIYVNAPSNGVYHAYPGDNFRFYGDAGQALAFWSNKKSWPEEILYPVKVCETFHVFPIAPGGWIDFVCVWSRVENDETDGVTSITMPIQVRNNVGFFEQRCRANGLRTMKTIPDNYRQLS